MHCPDLYLPTTKQSVLYTIRPLPTAKTCTTKSSASIPLMLALERSHALRRTSTPFMLALGATLDVLRWTNETKGGQIKKNKRSVSTSHIVRFILVDHARTYDNNFQSRSQQRI